MKTNEATLQEFDEQARRAFYWTSFDPEKRGERTIKEHEQQLLNDIEKMPESEQERYISNYKGYFSKWLSSSSRCSSSVITGGSGFNVRRAEKANNAERNAYSNFSEWREKALNAIEKRIEDDKPEQQKHNEAWACLENDIMSSAATIHGINTGIERGYSKALFVSSIYKKVETYANKGNVEIVQKAIDCIRNFNETMSVVITERHKFFKLIEVAESRRESIKDKSEKENTEVRFKGLTVVNNFKENRIQLIFDEKPDYSTISKLKRIGLKWSPSFGAWQRQMTGNAVYAIKGFIRDNDLILKKEA